MKEARHKRPYIVWFDLYEMSKIGNSIETKTRLVVARGRGRGEQGVTANGHEVIWSIFEEMECSGISDDGYTIL